jgi:putative RecB family exonuclease
MTPNAFVLANAPWSVSKANTARECPKKFKYQYLEKLKMPRTKAYEASTGQIVHRALEIALGGASIARSFEVALSQVRDPLSTEEIEDVMSYQSAVQRFLGKFTTYRTNHHGADPVMEQKLAVDINGNAVPFFDNSRAFLRGVVDMSMAFKGTNNALILDHKTGKYKDLAYYRDQFDMYLLLLKAANPAFEFIQLGINFLKVNKIEFIKGLTDVRDIAPIQDRLVRFLNDSTRDMHDLDRTRRGPLCGWCEYQVVCPAFTGGKIDGGKTEETQGADAGPTQ